MRFKTTITRFARLAPAVGFEPTTNRLTADRSTTELRWITQLKNRESVFSRTIGLRQLPISSSPCGQTHSASLPRYFKYNESVVFSYCGVRHFRHGRTGRTCPHSEECSERHGDYGEERRAQRCEGHKESGAHGGLHVHAIIGAKKFGTRQSLCRFLTAAADASPNKTRHSS